jgi:hypothetical protein
MEKVLRPFGIYYGHLDNLMDIWKFSGNEVHFPPFWYIESRKIWQPWAVENLFILPFKCKLDATGCVFYPGLQITDKISECEQKKLSTSI